MELTADTPDSCLRVSATALGFHVYRPDESAPEETLKAIEGSIRYKNLVGLELLSETIAKTALDPTTSMRGKLDAAETMRKLAGLDRKQDAVQTSGPGYQLVINLGTSAPETFKGATITQEPTADTDASI